MIEISHLVLPSRTLIELANVACGASVVCGIAILVSVLLWRRSNPVRHGLLVSALLVSLFCPLIVLVAAPLGLSFVRLDMVEASGGPLSIPDGTERPIGDSPRHRAEIEISSGVPSGNLDLGNHAAKNLASRTSATVLGRVDRPAVPSSSHVPWRGIATLTACVWAVGILLALLNVTRGAWFVRAFGRTCAPVTQPRLLVAMRRAEQRLRFRWSIPLQSSALAVAPLVVGLWHPRIVIPDRMEWDLDDHQLVDVFVHELAHLKRRDHWIGALQRAATICYWWNPLVRWVSCLISDLRERICDDLASDSSREHHYARALVKLAELAALEPHVPAAIGILSFKGNHLRKRISRLLDPDRSRVMALGRTGWFSVALASCGFSALIAIGSVSLRPTSVAAGETTAAASAPEPDDKPAKPADNNAAKSGPPYRLADRLRGTVTTEEGAPIPRAKVTFEFGAADKYDEVPFKAQRRLELSTDEKGQYEVDARDFPAIQEYGFDIMVYAAASGFAEAWSGAWYRANEAPVAELPVVKLTEGRDVRGRVEGSGGRAPDQVILRAFASVDSTSLWVHRPQVISRDGNFVITVPKKVAAELMLVSGNFAPLRIVVPPEVSQIERAVLLQGTSLTGRVLNRDGQPISGCVVSATEESDERQGAYRATKTDARGEYRLPPLRGKFRVHLANSAPTSDRIVDEELRSDNKPPPLAPISVTLSGESGEQQLNIQAGPTLTVQGVIRWADGRPAVKCEMMAWSHSIQLERLQTDDAGRYSMLLPRPIDDISISAIGLLDEQGTFHIAHPVTATPAKYKSEQFLVFDRLDQDLLDADWELRRFQPAKAAIAAPGSDELSRLRKQNEEQTEKYRVADAAAKTAAEQTELYNTQDPRNVIGPQLVALEAKYRGGPTAVEAIEWLVGMARSVGDPEIPVAKAREQIVDVLIEHYLKHPDLNLFLSQFESGPSVKRGEILLRAALESPHRNVRAAAAYHLASYQWHKLEASELRDQLQLFTKLLSDEPEIGPRLEGLKSLMQQYQVENADKVRQEAEQLAETVRKDYADVTPPKQDYWTFGERAEALLFEMRHLGYGKIAPEIQGVDVDGNLVHLTKLRGKFVVVSFTYAYPQNFEHLQPLTKHFSRDQVAVINIMSSADTGEVQKRIKAGEINWPVIADTGFGSVTRRWNIHGWPRTYVIDPSGVIRGIDVPSEWLIRFVDRLLATNKK
jgi:beta-lactamase regulating signal transducer with metallopeptidase domain/peroxiredoxin